MSNRYGDFLSMILIILVVAILGIGGYFVYGVISKNAINDNAESAIDEFEKSRKAVRKTSNTTDEEEDDGEERDLLNEISNLTTSSSKKNTKTQEAEKTYMEGYEVKGVIEIPKTNVQYPILSQVQKRSLEIAVAIAYSTAPGLNEPGNVTIYGHNQRNGLFFSNNKKLSQGDKIFITDQSGEKLEYEIYNIYETTPNDAVYMTRPTGKRREISLQTCTDAGDGRIIIWAVAKDDKNLSTDESDEEEEVEEEQEQEEERQEENSEERAE